MNYKPEFTRAIAAALVALACAVAYATGYQHALMDQCRTDSECQAAYGEEY